MSLFCCCFQYWLDVSKYISPNFNEPKIALRNVFGMKYLIIPVCVHTHEGGVRDFTYTFPLERQETQEEYARQEQQMTRVNLDWQDFDQEGSGEEEDEDEEELQILLTSLEDRGSVRPVGRLQAQSAH